MVMCFRERFGGLEVVWLVFVSLYILGIQLRFGENYLEKVRVENFIVSGVWGESVQKVRFLVMGQKYFQIKGGCDFFY